MQCNFPTWKPITSTHSQSIQHSMGCCCWLDSISFFLCSNENRAQKKILKIYSNKRSALNVRLYEMDWKIILDTGLNCKCAMIYKTTTTSSTTTMMRMGENNARTRQQPKKQPEREKRNATSPQKNMTKYVNACVAHARTTDRNVHA